MFDGPGARSALLAIVLTLGACAAPPPVETDVSKDGDGRRPADASREPAAARDLRPSPVARSDFELGLRITMEAYREVGFVDTDSLTERVSEIGYRVASLLPNPPLLTFHLIDLPYPNAFALPGGFIFVTKGMLDMGLTDAELAALLGHEIGHVVNGHFGRSQRLSSILSLAEIAMLVGAIVVGNEMGGTTRYERQDDVVYQGSTGGAAVMQGVPAFGGLFRTLVERKYGRGLEFEADETGARLAAAAGYPSDSAVRMLRRFRERIHEETTYGYWLTHPYFDDRITRAVAQARGLRRVDGPPPSFRFRRAVQRELFRLATAREDELQAAFLYQLALGAEPFGMPALEAGHEILKFRTSLNARRKPLEKRLGPIVADYDSLLVRAHRIDGRGALRRAMTDDRDSLLAELERLRPLYIERIDSGLRPTSVMERFVDNYPHDERFPELLFQLGENYRRSGRFDEAVTTFTRLWTGHPDSEWWGHAVSAMPALLPRVESPVALQSLLEAALPDSVVALAFARMDSLVASVETMELASEFVESYPKSAYSGPMRDRLYARADDAYREARILEGVARQQQALDAYHRILFFAPESPAAVRARERIDFLVRTG